MNLINFLLTIFLTCKSSHKQYISKPNAYSTKQIRQEISRTSWCIRELLRGCPNFELTIKIDFTSRVFIEERGIEREMKV